MEADEGAAVAEPEPHDDESDSSSDDEEEDSDEEMDDASDEDSDSDDAADTDSSDSDDADSSDSEDESDSSSSDEEVGDSDEDSDSDDDDSSVEEDVPTPDTVEHEYTYPQDFEGKSWMDVVPTGQYFRLILDPSCIVILHEQFRECKYLIEIVYPEEGKDSKLLRIGSWAFGNCCNLQRMTPFPDGLVELGDGAFISCLKLQGRLTIPSSIQFVRRRCFRLCKSITSVVFESSTATNTTVVELEDEIFWYCEELRSVRLPINLTVIPSQCFYACILLIDVTIPGTVRTIQSWAFTNCRALRTVDLPENVIAIDERAYSGCSDLESVTIQSSRNAVQVGRNVFQACASLVTIRVVNPLVWSRVLSAMNYDPSFLYKFVRKYEGQIMTHHRSSR